MPSCARLGLRAGEALGVSPRAPAPRVLPVGARCPPSAPRPAGCTAPGPVDAREPPKRHPPCMTGEGCRVGPGSWGAGPWGAPRRDDGHAPPSCSHSVRGRPAAGTGPGGAQLLVPPRRSWGCPATAHPAQDGLWQRPAFLHIVYGVTFQARGRGATARAPCPPEMESGVPHGRLRRQQAGGGERRTRASGGGHGAHPQGGLSTRPPSESHRTLRATFGHNVVSELCNRGGVEPCPPALCMLLPNVAASRGPRGTSGEFPVPTFSDALSCAGGPAPGSSGGGGARRFFTSDLSDTPEMLLSDRDGPNVTEREFTDGEFGVVKQPCRGETDTRCHQPETPSLCANAQTCMPRGQPAAQRPEVMSTVRPGRPVQRGGRCHMTEPCCDAVCRHHKGHGRLLKPLSRSRS